MTDLWNPEPGYRVVDRRRAAEPTPPPRPYLQAPRSQAAVRDAEAQRRREAEAQAEQERLAEQQRQRAASEGRAQARLADVEATAHLRLQGALAGLAAARQDFERAVEAFRVARETLPNSSNADTLAGLASALVATHRDAVTAADRCEASEHDVIRAELSEARAAYVRDFPNAGPRDLGLLRIEAEQRHPSAHMDGTYPVTAGMLLRDAGIPEGQTDARTLAGPALRGALEAHVSALGLRFSSL